jgi:hypothetical protein
MSNSDADEKPKRQRGLQRPLTDQERDFVKYRISGMHSDAAAKLVGWERAPHNNQRVQRALEKAVSAQQKKLNGLRLRIVETLMDVAFGDPRQLMSWSDDSVDIVKSRDLTPAAAAMVSSVSYDTKGNVKVNFDNKWRALELLAKFATVVEPKEAIKIEGPTGWIDMVRDAALAAHSTAQRQLPEARIDAYVQSVTTKPDVVVDAELVPSVPDAK